MSVQIELPYCSVTRVLAHELLRAVVITPHEPHVVILARAVGAISSSFAEALVGELFARGATRIEVRGASRAAYRELSLALEKHGLSALAKDFSSSAVLWSH